MAITGVSLIESWDFTSDHDDAPDDEKTVWVLQPIDVNVRAHLGDITFSMVQTPDGGTEQRMKTATRNVEAMRFGIRAVRNFKDAEGNDVILTFEERPLAGKIYRVLSDRSIGQIPPTIWAELGNEILTKNSLTEDMRKKLLML